MSEEEKHSHNFDLPIFFNVNIYDEAILGPWGLLGFKC